MVSIWNSVKSGNKYVIRDEKVDHYGQRVATCSSDGSIKIYDISRGFQFLSSMATLKGHSGPVCKISWAPPQFGSILASCSDDRKVIIWKENNDEWQKCFEYSGHDSSVNSVAWADHLAGLRLAWGSLDGTVSILTHVPKEKKFEIRRIKGAHLKGCNTISWCPPRDIDYMAAVDPGQSKTASIKRFASGGFDGLIKIWREDGDRWIVESQIEDHSDTVWDIAWAPPTASNKYVIASYSEGGRIIVSTSYDLIRWNSTVLTDSHDLARRVRWSTATAAADMLSVTGADNQVTLWKMDTEGKWEKDEGVKIWDYTDVLFYVTKCEYVMTIILYIVTVIFIVGYCVAIFR